MIGHRYADIHVVEGDFACRFCVGGIPLNVKQNSYGNRPLWLTAILSQLLQAGCYSAGLGQKVPYCPSLDGKELQFSPLDQSTFYFQAHSSPTDDTYLCFSKSRISVRSLTSAVGSGSSGCSLFSLFIPLTTRNNTLAMMKKFNATVKN
jgi:hypothetical protein